MSISGLVTGGYIVDPFSVTKVIGSCEEIIGIVSDVDEEIIGIVEDCGLATPLSTGWTTSPGPYTEADIIALNQYASPLSPFGEFQVNLCPVDAYLVAVYSDDFAGAVPANFIIGGFLTGGASEIQSGLSMTTPNGVKLFTVARSSLKVTSTGINWQRIN